MATYYVRPNGSDSNTGTGPATNQAWATIQKALGATSGVVGGDIIYVAPGHYFEQVVVGFTSPSSTVQIIGDVTGAQFSSTSGIVRLSGFSSAGNAAIVYTGAILKGTSKNNLSFSNFIFEGKGSGLARGNGLVSFVTSQNMSFSKCIFAQEGYDGNANAGSVVDISPPTSSPVNATFSKCVFGSARFMVYINGNNVADTTSFKDCIFYGGQYQLNVASLQTSVFNCTFQGAYASAFESATGSATFPSTLRNNIFLFCATAISSTASHRTEDYNRFIGAASTGATPGSNSSTVGSSRLTYGYARMVGLAATDFWSPEQNSPNQGFGTATGAEATDVYSTAWTGATPDAGYQTYSVSSTLTPTYQPTERNASTITIAPGSTSQSIELYLGATGLTASTSGLSARYNRTRTASVSIALVARTIAQAWTSGGFAEVDSTNMPGVYRLDLPDAALAAGADDVTIVVRGASGTNGAVMTVKLSSGGLTEAQTASAVWGESPAGYATATTFGGVLNETNQVANSTETIAQDIPGNVWDESYTTHTAANTFGARVLKTTVDNRPAVVGTSQHIHANVHAIVDSTVAADELSGALLHNGTDYISADLLTPVTGATSVHIGPYQLLADGLGASDALDIQQSTVQDIAVRCIDANGSSVSLSGATVTAKVYNSVGTLVATYAGTITYAADGWLTFGLTTAVTNTVGTYTITITRTTSATDTSIYGPLRMYVRGI